jgi:hypothetical protein
MSDEKYDYRNKKRLQDWGIIFRQGHLHHKKIVCDVKLGKMVPNILRMQDFQDYPGYYRDEAWTDRPGSELQAQGYMITVGLHDSIIWSGIPVYTRIAGGTMADLSKILDKDGRRIYSRDSASTLNDAMQSNATEDFRKGLGKASATLTMDIQKIAMIGILAVGAVFGMIMMGVI